MYPYYQKVTPHQKIREKNQFALLDFLRVLFQGKYKAGFNNNRLKTRSGWVRMADVAQVAFTERSGSSTKGRTYAILLQNLILSRFTRFSKGFHRALNENYPAFEERSTKTILLS